ncbi:HAMP domain-containing histidine kinase [Mucilaginibacter sp. UR6-1]|uniref:sensor histidine kinase n=1 Tax=Mucilaginibacter sp. UR6-1 TaxID=1435643 RepID=UPI001E5648AC|nr:HAMP domain-containing sensor histidine kinase [Mucilaginibacter sp. UR6-1]MCC8407900.1 HAMP domain-containing histidine kinase [Mucilaginibacter sp. UR6-1]
MDLDFASAVAVKSRAEFRNYYMQQNLKSIKKLCAIYFTLNLLFRIFLSAFPSSITRIHNFPEFNISVWVHLALTPLFYWIISSFHKNITATRKATGVMSACTVLFALYIIFSGMVSSFIVTYVPSDNLIGFMIALTVIAIICVFEHGQTMFITLVTGIIFTLVLTALSHSATEILYNELICCILLLGFFLISRYNYTYKANHYLQLVDINKKNREIEQASNFKTEVLGMVAHDLRNPIAAIESVAMLMELDEPDEDTMENLSMVKQSCEKARSIINDLLETARNENTDELALSRTEMSSFLKRLADGWNNSASIPNRVVCNSITGSIYADINTEKFQRVIDNLISNAAKFSKETDTINISLQATGKLLLIEVKDQGVGIPKDILPIIFERFSKAGRSGLRGEKSTGLGLSIVKQIVEKHGGKISVESIVGEGSTFAIKLPVST